MTVEPLEQPASPAPRPVGRGWAAEAVVAASTEWAWVPPDARAVRTDEYLVVAYPEYVSTPTGARFFGTRRDLADPAVLAGFVDEVHEVARGLGRDRLWWTVADGARSLGLEDELVRRGGEVIERLDVLGLPLTDGVPDLGVPADITVERVRDERTLRDAYEIEAEAFNWPAPTEEQMEAGREEIARGGQGDAVGRVVAYVDGEPAGVGGWGLVDDVCRLWGGATHPSLRGRGAYRAVLAERLRIATTRGATLGLTHGRIATSSPILQRVGFTRYGENHQLVVDL